MITFVNILTKKIAGNGNVFITLSDRSSRWKNIKQLFVFIVVQY